MRVQNCESDHEGCTEPSCFEGTIICCLSCKTVCSKSVDGQEPVDACLARVHRTNQSRCVRSSRSLMSANLRGLTRTLWSRNANHSFPGLSS